MFSSETQARFGLQAGSFRVRRSYPNFWTYYLKLLAHGYTHENAKWQARKCFELRKEEKKTVAKCQKRQEEQAKAQRAQQMLVQINKRKKQIVLEVEDMYGAKSKKDKKSPLKIKQESQQESQEENEYYEDEGNHRLVNAHGGVSQAGGASGSSTAPDWPCKGTLAPLLIARRAGLKTVKSWLNHPCLVPSPGTQHHMVQGSVRGLLT